VSALASTTRGWPSLLNMRDDARESGDHAHVIVKVLHHQGHEILSRLQVHDMIEAREDLVRLEDSSR
jgi:hypothetical protein